MSETRGEHEFDLLVTNASAVLGGLRNEQYRVVEGAAIGVVGPRIELDRPCVRPREQDRRRKRSMHVGCSLSRA